MEHTSGADPHPPRAVQLNFEIQTADGPMRGRLVAPEGGMTLPELAFNALGLVDRFVSQAERREADAGRAVSCRKGCGACCRQLVPVSPPEAWMVADLLAGTSPARRAVLVQRFETAQKTLDDAGLTTRLYETPPTDDAATELAWDYFRLGLACPFLEDESCSIHPVRPSMCREYLVTSPAEHCRDPFSKPVQRVGISVRLSQALARLTGELTGRPPQLIPLSLAPFWAAHHPRPGQFNARALLERLLTLMSER